MPAQTAHAHQAPPRTLDGLSRELLPLAIGNEAAYRRVQELVDRLAVLDRRTRAQEQYLETLTILMEAYEEANDAIVTSSGDAIDRLRFLLEQHGMSGRDLGRLLGQPQLGGKILRRERQLSRAHIRILAEHFKVGPELFL